VCPDAFILSQVTTVCSNRTKFTHAEAVANTTRNGITISIDGSDLEKEAYLEAVIDRLSGKWPAIFLGSDECGKRIEYINVSGVKTLEDYLNLDTESVKGLVGKDLSYLSEESKIKVLTTINQAFSDALEDESLDSFSSFEKKVRNLVEAYLNFLKIDNFPSKRDKTEHIEMPYIRGEDVEVILKLQSHPLSRDESHLGYFVELTGVVRNWWWVGSRSKVKVAGKEVVKDVGDINLNAAKLGAEQSYALVKDKFSELKRVELRLSKLKDFEKKGVYVLNESDRLVDELDSDNLREKYVSYQSSGKLDNFVAYLNGGCELDEKKVNEIKTFLVTCDTSNFLNSSSSHEKNIARGLLVCNNEDLFKIFETYFKWNKSARVVYNNFISEKDFNEQVNEQVDSSLKEAMSKYES